MILKVLEGIKAVRKTLFCLLPRVRPLQTNLQTQGNFMTVIIHLRCLFKRSQKPYRKISILRSIEMNNC
jgi:hypothetical protein